MSNLRIYFKDGEIHEGSFALLKGRTYQGTISTVDAYLEHSLSATYIGIQNNNQSGGRDCSFIYPISEVLKIEESNGERKPLKKILKLTI